MDLIVKTQEKQVTITVKGYLKAITSDDREIKFYISGENNIRMLQMNSVSIIYGITFIHITWEYHLSWILTRVIKQKFSSTYNKNHLLWKRRQYLMLLG